MGRHNRATLLLPALLAVLFIPSLRATAANNPPPQGITVTPAFQQVSVLAGDAQQPINFSVTNNEPKAQTINLSAADFNTLNESGGLFFVGTNPTALQKKYGLSKWLSLPQKQITLAPMQTISIQADVLNLPDLNPGGHYGALLLALADQGQSSQNNQVALHPIASSLLFVTKLGGDTHKLGLSQVSISRHTFSLPASVSLRFHNDGNTHLIPRGVVTVTNPRGEIVSKGIINDDSGIILPETFRRYFVPLQNVSSSNLPGRYKVKVDFRFDGLSKFRSYQQSFSYIPFGALILAVLIIIGALIIGHRLLRPKNKQNT